MLPFNRIIAVLLILLVMIAIAVVGIFQTGISHIESFAEAQALCGISGKASCDSAGGLPITWNMNSIDVNGTTASCAFLRGCNTCESCGFLRGCNSCSACGFS